VLEAFFTVEGSRERHREWLQENTYSRILSLLGKSLAQTRAKLVLGTTSDVFQVSWKENVRYALQRRRNWLSKNENLAKQRPQHEADGWE